MPCFGHEKPLENEALKDSTQCTPMISLPARIDPKGPRDFYLEFSMIYTQAMLKGIDFLVLEKNRVSKEGLHTDKKKRIHWPEKYGPAFRISAGLNVRDDWILYAEYFHYGHREKMSRISEPKELEFFIPDYITIPMDYCLKAKGNLHLVHDAINACLSRPSYLGNHFTYTPFLGLRADWTQKAIKEFFTDPDSFLVFPYFQNSSSWALGARTGVDAAYLLGSGFNLKGKAAFNLVYYHQHQTVQNYISGDGKTVSPYTDRNTIDQIIRPEIDLDLYLGWGRYLRDQKVHLEILAGYEFQALFSQQTQSEYYDTTLFYGERKGSSLFFSGFSLSVKVDF